MYALLTTSAYKSSLCGSFSLSLACLFDPLFVRCCFLHKLVYFACFFLLGKYIWLIFDLVVIFIFVKYIQCTRQPEFQKTYELKELLLSYEALLR